MGNVGSHNRSSEKHVAVYIFDFRYLFPFPAVYVMPESGLKRVRLLVILEYEGV
jgi:hypothetical protein